ncbi:hypothetical protein ACWG42_11615 [Amedibacillus sp. YH-ame10]
MSKIQGLLSSYAILKNGDKMEVIERYCEESYAQKQDIINELGSHIGNVIWDEIEAYRNRFLFVIPKVNCHVILCRSVVFKILKTEQKLHQVNIRDTNKVEEEPNPIWDMLRHQLDTIEQIDMQEWIQVACTLLRVPSVEDVEMLFSLDIPFTLVAFLCMIKFPSTNREILYLYLMKENLLHLFHYFPDNDEVDVRLEPQIDVTYHFLRFLDQILLKICEGMVLLNSSKKQERSNLSFEELKECYPQLHEEQIRFYLAHRKQNHYYDIQQYLLFANVCYETGRSSMDKLVELGWYRKRKTGKKFVYYIGS